jgi:predicted dehydrogenase
MKLPYWGVLGLGQIATTFAEDLVQVQTSQLYGVASRNYTKAKSFATKFQAQKAYGSYQDLINDPEIDVVYIATPHAFHFKWALACLRAKKHVLCEKPMCLNAIQTERLIAEAKQQNCFLMEAIWTRFMPTMHQTIALLDAKRIGDVVAVEADFGFKPDYNPQSRLFNPSLGGGSLMDIGLYPIFLSLLFLGSPSTVKAMARKAPTGVDAYCSMMFDYPNGEKALLKSTFELVTATEAYIYGTKGSLKLHTRFHKSQKVEVFDEDHNSVELFQLPYQGNGYIHEIEEVNNCILQQHIQSDLLPLSFSLELAQLLDRVKGQIGLKYDTNL